MFWNEVKKLSWKGNIQRKLLRFKKTRLQLEWLEDRLTPAGLTPADHHVLAAYGRLPLSFVPNGGQTAAQVQYLSQGNGYTLFLTPTGSVLSLQQPVTPTASALKQPVGALGISAASTSTTGVALAMNLVGSNPFASVVGQDPLPGTSNYFIGNDPSQWHTNVTNYSKVDYQNVYPGINLVYYGNQPQLEYDFVVAPGANPDDIRFNLQGVESITLDAKGNLVLHTALGDVQEHSPTLYQEVGGKQWTVSGQFVLLGTNEVGFQVGAYDKSLPLVIDPVLTYSTYLGGSAADYGFGVAVDGSGNAYVTGYTLSTNFPTTTGVFQSSLSGSEDAFVTKLNASGTGLLYSTYLGGNTTTYGQAIAVDGSGNAYIAGATNSSTFPTTSGAFQTSHASDSNNEDAFITKLNASGNALLYSTFLGGNSLDDAYAIAIDGSGDAYVTGKTDSSNFPTTTSAFQKSGASMFVTKLNATGAALVYSTYLGGGFDDIGYGIAVDGLGNAYITGQTNSSSFPTTTGAFHTTYYGGTDDAFVTKLNASGTALIYSTYLGGSNTDVGFGIALDGSGNAYVTGYTLSTNFPTTTGAFQTTSGGYYDTFVTKLNANGTALVYSNYLGGSATDIGQGIAVDGFGAAYITGYTYSTNFPTTSGAFQTSHASDSGHADAFVTKLNASGTALVYCTYMGGNSDDVGQSIVVDSSGNPYIAGYTSSTNFPTTAGAFKTSFGGGSYDTFVTKFSFTPTTTTLTDSGPNPSEGGTAVSFTTTVTPVAGPAISGETVNIEDASNGNAVVATPTITNGTATFTISNLSVATHNLFAVYPGDANNAASQSSQSAQVVQSGFQVVSTVATPNGVEIIFNAPVNVITTHMYNSPSSSLGAPDVTVTGSSTGAVEGSLSFDPSQPWIGYFVKTAGALATDTYTVAVSTAVKDAGGNALGSAYSNNLSVTAPSTPLISIASFARGPGQAVNVPNTASGIPVSIANATNVTSATFSVQYNPTLLTIAASGAVAPSSAANSAGLSTVSYTIASVDANNSILTVTISAGSGNGLTAGSTPVALVDIAATVPYTAPYLSKAELLVSGVSVNSSSATGVSGIDEDGYLGDVLGQKGLNAQEALVVLQDSTGLGSGFDAYADLDPIIIGDPNSSGQLTAADALQILKASVGNTVAQIPAIPNLSSSITAASWSSNSVTITTAAANNFSVGQTVVISGMAPSGYNGTFTVASVISSTQFTYSLSNNPGTATSFGMATLNLATGLDPQLFFPSFSVVAGQSSTVSLWMTNTSGQPLPLSSLDEAILFNPNEFTVSNVVKGSLLSGGWSLAANVNNSAGYLRVGDFTTTPIVIAGGTITAAKWSKGTVSITTSAANDFSVGQTVVIKGMTPAAFNGTFTVASVESPTQFTYALVRNPGKASANGIAGASGPVLSFTVTASAKAGGTTTPLNLARSVSSNGSTTYTDAYSNAGELTLNPAPTNSPNDRGVDGVLTIERTGNLLLLATKTVHAGSNMDAVLAYTIEELPIALSALEEAT